MRILIDKGVIRRALEGLTRIVKQQPLTSEQRAVLNLVREYHKTNKLYISNKSYHTLIYRFGHQEIIQTILNIAKVLYPTKYARRWARRLRYLGFGREDALMISMGSFSTDKPFGGQIVGVHKIITLDKRMYERFQENYDEIRMRFDNSNRHLDKPFSLVELPSIEIIQIID